MVEWTTDKPKRRRKYRPLLDEIKKEQDAHPFAWAEIGRFRNVSSGHSGTNQLKLQYADEGFEFRSSLDQTTGESVVYARYVGVTDE